MFSSLLFPLKPIAFVCAGATRGLFRGLRSHQPGSQMPVMLGLCAFLFLGTGGKSPTDLNILYKKYVQKK
jgi:hypothetical protein